MDKHSLKMRSCYSSDSQKFRQSLRIISNKEYMDKRPQGKETYYKRRQESRSNKRTHSEIASPVTTQSDRMSPQSKYRQRITPKPNGTSVINTPPPSLGNSICALLMETDSKLNPSKAVPAVALEPPSPKLLPTPPTRWVGDSLPTSANRQVCGNVTQSLLKHLNTTGFLLSAH